MITDLHNTVLLGEGMRKSLPFFEAHEPPSMLHVHILSGCHPDFVLQLFPHMVSVKVIPVPMGQYHKWSGGNCWWSSSESTFVETYWPSYIEMENRFIARIKNRREVYVANVENPDFFEL